MRDHIRILAILHIVFGSLGIAAALIVLLVFGGLAGVVGVAGDTADADRTTGMAVLGGIGVVVFLIILVLSVPGVIAGIGLLKFRPWSRMLTIVLSALDLFSVPIGTALGIYGLWVLLSQPTEALFRDQPPAIPRSNF
jgi:amino acid transporter